MEKICPKCEAKAKKQEAWRRKNAEKIRQYNREYYLKIIKPRRAKK